MGKFTYSKELIKECKKGNRKAIEELLKSNQNTIYNYAYYFSHNEEDAKEITQEVMMIIYKNIKNFRESSSLSTWIYKITKNAYLKYVSSNPQIELLQSPESFSDDNLDTCTIFESLEKKDLIKTLKEKIKTLPATYRHVILLREFEEFSYKEISEILNIPIGSVKSIISRVREFLRKELSRNRR